MQQKRPEFCYRGYQEPVLETSYVHDTVYIRCEMDTLHVSASPYFTTLSDLKDTLAKYGVAVLPSITDTQFCSDVVDSLWNSLAQISSGWKLPISRDNRESWGTTNFDALHGKRSRSQLRLRC